MSFGKIAQIMKIFNKDVFKTVKADVFKQPTMGSILTDL